MIYFDNAATTFPKPMTVKTAVDSALTCYGANPGRSGHDLSLETSKKVFEVREKAAAFFQTKTPENVVFTQNCTYALNTVIKGLLSPGDHVVISDLEHNSVLRPIHTLASRGIITYSVASVFFEEDRTLHSFANAIRPNTKAVITTGASNVFGVKLPVRQLARLLRQYGVYYIVDAAQTAGMETIDLSTTPIDFLCTAGHKGLYGPPGTGLLITECGQKLRPLAEGGTGSSSADYGQPDFMPDHLEAGTINTAGILGLGAGIDFVNKCNVSEIAKQEMKNIRYIYEELRSMQGVELYTAPPTVESSVAVLSFNLSGLNSEETAARLNDKGFALRGGLHCAPLAHKKFGTIDRGTARLSLGAFNTPDQAEAFVAAVYSCVNKA